MKAKHSASDLFAALTDRYKPPAWGPLGFRIAHDDGLRAWWWRISGARFGGFFEVVPGDTIMLMAWLGWWAVRVGYDFPIEGE